MEHLIEYQDYQIKVSPELLLIKPFRVLHNADRTKNKDTFMSQLSIVYFGYDPRSTYSYISDEKERLAAIIEQEGLPKNFKIDGKLQECIDIYKKHVITKSYLLLQDTMIAVDKVREFLRDIDLTATDEKGKPLYTINQVTTAIKQIPELAKALKEAQDKVTKELEEQGRARGTTTKKIFEDDITLD